jgi:hypothetical protein
MDSNFIFLFLTGFTRFVGSFFPGFPPARYRPPEADSGEAGGDESLEIQSPSAKKIKIASNSLGSPN